MYEQIFNWVGLHFHVFSIVVLLLLIIGIIILSSIKSENIKRNVLLGCSIGYAFLLYFLTLGIRVKGSQSEVISDFRWIKFDFLKFCFSGVIWGDLANLLLFMPYGILFCMSKKRERRFVACLISAACVSAVIEEVQFIFKNGYCDVNDWLWNVLGAVFGYVLSSIIDKVNKRR